MKSLQQRIEDHEFPPYVYSYPTTRAYKPLKVEVNPLRLDFTDELNVYIHIPFCEQKCTFCGYLTTIERSPDARERYVDAVVKEVALHRPLLSSHTIASVNFGGGTPSLLTPSQFGRILQSLDGANPLLRSTSREISIEATPESVSIPKFMAFKELGLNRVSVGIQTLDNKEIKSTKRHNLHETSIRAIEALHSIGIPNICADLMYGLQGQTLSSFEKSLRGVVGLQTHTIELYALALHPTTPLGRKRPDLMDNKDKYRCYDVGRQTLLEEGFTHDCHLRFIRPGGGYHQQEHVFAGQSLLGFGVGARSYTPTIHYRNSNQPIGPSTAVQEYIAMMERGDFAIKDGTFVNRYEQMRRYVLYNLERLDLDMPPQLFQGERLEHLFPSEFRSLLDLGLTKKDGSFITLTQAGLKYRDLIATTFFNPALRKDEQSYWNGV